MKKVFYKWMAATIGLFGIAGCTPAPVYGPPNAIYDSSKACSAYSLQATSTEVTLKIGDKQDLLSYLKITGTDSKKLVWAVDDTSILTIDASTCTSKKEGTAKVTVYVESCKEVKAEITIKVAAK